MVYSYNPIRILRLQRLETLLRIIECMRTILPNIYPRRQRCKQHQQPQLRLPFVATIQATQTLVLMSVSAHCGRVSDTQTQRKSHSYRLQLAAVTIKITALHLILTPPTHPHPLRIRHATRTPRIPRTSTPRNANDVSVAVIPLVHANHLNSLRLQLLCRYHRARR